MAKVSVIIPCYNHGQYLDEAVDSILNQTFQDVEIFVVDDGSTDELTIRILAQYQKPKTTVIRLPHGGVAIARNTGIAAANGEYILMLDADDYFERTFLEKAIQVLETRPEIGAVSCGLQRFGANTRKVMPTGGGIEQFVLGINACGNALYRKICLEQAGGYDSTLQGDEDWDLFINITKRGWQVAVIPEYLFYYRQHPTSRRIRARAWKPAIIRRLIQNHREVFQTYVEEVVLEREQRIYEMKSQNESVFDSWDYRVGKFILTPVRRLVRIGRKITNIVNRKEKDHGKS